MNIEKALDSLDQQVKVKSERKLIPYAQFLEAVIADPDKTIRSIFQVFHDMVKSYVGEGQHDLPDDPESINYALYDCSKLFVEGSDNPYFADFLFANRFLKHIDAMRQGAQQNKIYIFEGPPGCGKSTFLNNLLLKCEEYVNTDDGSRYEIVWRLNKKALGGGYESDGGQLIENLFKFLEKNNQDSVKSKLDPKREKPEFTVYNQDEFIEIPCPSHDNPILLIPKHRRREFFDDILKNDKFKWKLFTQKEYEWVFRQNPCTICSSLFEAINKKIPPSVNLFEMVHARKYHFNRRLGEGISVFNPGDKLSREFILTNKMLQERINTLLQDSNLVQYIFSRYAKTNNGIYALMDIKQYNVERMNALHNIISEGVHKVGDVEENVNSLFFALMNPEDKTNIEGTQSFSDRIEFIKINYVLDLNTEVEIYRSIFGKHIDDSFLPRILKNFARVIISSRLNEKSEALLDWVPDPKKYSRYCDENLLLLKMEMYRGIIPSWLSEEDRNRLNAYRRRKIVAESETEGLKGFSGRDSIKIFNNFYSTYARQDKLITMSNLCTYFVKLQKKVSNLIPDGFLDSLHKMYDYTVLQEVKESLYYYNEDQISRDILNYMFAVNFDIGSSVKCSYTNEKLEVTEEFFKGTENRIFGPQVNDQNRQKYRKTTQREYTAQALTQEMMVEKKPVTETSLYQNLYERYVYNLKEKVLDPFLENENFRRAIKDYASDDFRTYDKRIRDDVTFLIKNLMKKYKYTEIGAKEVCIYVIDNDLAKSFSQ